MAGPEDETPTRDTGTHGLESELLLARARAKMLGAGPTPTAVGRYRILEKLGSGGMGLVYAAHDDELDRRVAIKILRGDISDGLGGRPRMIREAQVMARLSHPNVAHVYEVGHHKGQVFIAMELVEGTTLRRWCRQDRTALEILRMHLRAGKGLVAAHDAGIIHRDYKADNVLVGKDGRPRVLDFGLSRPEEELATLAENPLPVDSGAQLRSSPELTVTGTVLGTPAYMAPEQIDGANVDARADQFAFCASLYEALYDQRPFQGSSVTQLSQSMRSSKPRRVDPKEFGVPRAVHAALLRGLSADREDRYASMAALLEALGSPFRSRSTRWALGGTVAGLLTVALAGSFAMLSRGGDPNIAERVDPEDAWRAEVLARSDLPPVHTSPIPEDPARVSVHRLDNGLTVYIAPRVDEPHIEAKLVVRADITDDRQGHEGTSALATLVLRSGSRSLGTVDFELERPHLERQLELLGRLAQAKDEAERVTLIRDADAAYRATADLVIPFEIAEVERELGFPGGVVEPHFASIFTSTVPRNRLGAWAELSAEPMIDPVFRGFASHVAADAELTREGVEQSFPFEVARERLADATGQRVSFQAAFDHALSVPYDDVTAFHDTYYRPNNSAVVLVGDVTALEVLPVLERAFGSWEPAPLPEKTYVDVPLPDEQIVEEIRDARPESTLLAFPLPPENAGDRNAFEAFAEAAAGQDGLLATLLVAPGIAAYTEVVLEGRAFYTVGVAPPGDDAAELETSMVAALQAIADGELPESAWDAAIARQRLEATRWAASPVALAEKIAHAYAERRPWSEVVDGMRRGADRKGLAETAGVLLRRGFVSVRVDEGPPHRVVAPSVPAGGVPKAPAGRHSPLGERLLASPAAKLEPQFLAEGRDYSSYQYGGGRVVVAPDPNPLFRVRWSWPIGVDAEPLVCDALAAKVSTRYGWPGLRGVEIKSTCASNEVALELLGVDAAFEEVWPSFLSFVQDTEIPFDDAAGHLLELQAARQGVRESPLDKLAALHVFALRGRHGIDAKLPPDEAVPHVNPNELGLVLRRVARVAPDVSYVGPRGDLFVAALPAATGIGVERPPLRFREFDQTTIFVMHDKGRPDVAIRVSARVPDLPHAQVLAELFEQFVHAEPELMSDVAGLTVQSLGWVGTSHRIAHHLEVRAEAVDAARGVELGRALLHRPRNREAFEHTHERAEAAYRAARTAPRDIPAAIGTNKFANWLTLAAIEFEEFSKYADTVAGAPLVVTVLADLNTVDKSTFAPYGDVVEVAPSEILRDPDLNDLDSVGVAYDCNCEEEDE